MVGASCGRWVRHGQREKHARRSSSQLVELLEQQGMNYSQIGESSVGVMPKITKDEREESPLAVLLILSSSAA